LGWDFGSISACGTKGFSYDYVWILSMSMHA
jgi:hypothetical protein